VPTLSRSFYELQASNRRKTVLLIVCFVALFAAVGFGLDYYFFDVHPFDFAGGAIPIPVGTLFAVGLATVMALQGYYGGDRQVLGATHARPADPQNPAEKQLLNVVEEMSLAAGINPPPPVYVVPDPDPNAFAVGRDPRHASVAVTEGLLATLDREELQGVMAHELGHVRNLDIRTMTLVAALFGGLVLLSDFAQRGLRFGGARVGGGGRRGGGRSSGGGAILLLVLWLALVVLAPLIGRLLALAVSRSREYDADATGAELTRNPLGLASALRHIEGATEPTRSIGRGAAHLCIADPVGRQVNESEGAWASFWGTHPPMRKRIAILESMAGVMGSPERPIEPETGPAGSPAAGPAAAAPRAPGTTPPPVPGGGMPGGGVQIGHG
jgi:heat shock protein HtpX